jgi:hypothetical protein
MTRLLNQRIDANGRPVVDAVRFLPKADLAEFARTLIAFTAFRLRMSMSHVFSAGDRERRPTRSEATSHFYSWRDLPLRRVLLAAVLERQLVCDIAEPRGGCVAV